MPLAFIYPRWEIEPAVWWQWLFPVAAAGVVAGLWLARRRLGKGPLVAVLFFAGTLGPALGFVNVYPMRYSFVADHFQYLAGVGLITLCAAGLARMPRIIPATLVVLLGALAWQQAGIYRNLETLWRDTLAKNPDCWLAHNNLGLLLNNQGRNEEAMEHYRKAVQIDPNDFEALYNLGIALAAQGQFNEAIENFRKAIQIKPNDCDALNNLGIALAAKGRFDEAFENFRKAIQINPNDCDALDNLGTALAERGQFDEAIENYHKAIQINSNRPQTFFHLGTTLGQSGRTREAVVQYREALKLNPNLAGALNNLAWILASNPDDELRNGAEAVRLAERACELTHYGQPVYIGTLAAAYAEARRFGEAVETAQRALNLPATQNNKPLADALQMRLKLYESSAPFHEKP